MLVSKTDIITVIPQRPPFVMIDELVWNNEQAACTSFQIEAGNIFVENGQFKEPGLVENIAQTVAARAGYIARISGQPVQVGYIAAIKNLAIYGLPRLEDQLLTQVTELSRVFNVLLVKGRVSCRESLLAECEMKIFISPSN
jgi:predicted hotdog family 3-hydroxylacyl-ACP dehydratase